MEDFREDCAGWGRLQALRKAWFEGQLTMPKTYIWLTGLICLLGGVIWGLRMAPMSHGVTIGSYNGNGSSSGFWRETPEDGKRKKGQKSSKIAKKAENKEKETQR